MNKQLQNAGRFIYAVPMAIFGLEHFMNASQMAGMVPGFIPGGAFWIYLTGIALLAAAVSIMSKKLIWLSSVLLAVLLLVFVLTIHIPGLFNEATMQTSLINLLKDVSLAGSALFIAGNAGREKTIQYSG